MKTASGGSSPCEMLNGPVSNTGGHELAGAPKTQQMSGLLKTIDLYQIEELLCRKILKLGKSVSWQDAISLLTDGKRDRFTADPIVEYFKPLHDWLRKYNEENNVTVGWKQDNLTVKF